MARILARLAGLDLDRVDRMQRLARDAARELARLAGGGSSSAYVDIDRFQRLGKGAARQLESLAGVALERVDVACPRSILNDELGDGSLSSSCHGLLTGM